MFIFLMFYLFDILSSYSFTGDSILTHAYTVKTRTKENYLILQVLAFLGILFLLSFQLNVLLIGIC